LKSGGALRLAIACLLSLSCGAWSAARAEPAAATVPGEARGVVAIAGESEILSLANCLTEAMAGNGSLRAERLRREELRGQMTQARAIGLPTIDLSGTWSRGRDPSFAFNETFSGGDGGEIGDSPLDTLLAGLSFLPDAEDIPAQSFWRTSLNARWEFRPGLVYNAIGAAGLGIERQELLLADAERRTAESVMAAYYSVIMADEQLAAINADLAAREEFLDVTRRRFHLGLSTPLDTLRAAVSLANLAPQRRSAAQRLSDAGSQLNVLMGRRPLAPLRLRGELPIEEEIIPVDLALAGLAARPDIRQLELVERILRKNRGAQKAEHRPYLSADASYGYVTSVLDDLTKPGHDFWSANVSLNVPLFDGMLTRGKVKETEATIRRTVHERAEALRQARLEVLTLHGDLEAARSNLAATTLNLAAAEDALNQVSRRYELGKADYLSVLDVRTERFLARSNCIAARNEVLTLTAALKRALGFAPATPLSELRARLAEFAARPDGTRE